jgi:carboxylate-amine ligase
LGYTLRAMEHRFSGPSYTLGIEEELMIVDEQTLDLVNSIERLLSDLSEVPTDGEVKPELMESVCEIATTPVKNTVEAGIQLRALRRTVNQVAQQHGLRIGSAGTHPFALWEDQRIVGMRIHLPLLLALSANSPFWRGDSTGLDSTRTPIFRAFPRVGIPPRYDDFEDWSRRIEFMMGSKVIGDYTYLWYDVRPHPNFGTVEVRVMDSQTRVEHTLALAALVQAMVKELAEHFDEGQKLSRYPYEMLDENKWMAARHGLGAQLVDLPARERVPVPELTRRLMERLRPHAEELGSEEDFDCVEEILDRGNGASRQEVVYEANHDLREVVAEILDATVPEAAEATGE